MSIGRDRAARVVPGIEENSAGIDVGGGSTVYESGSGEGGALKSRTITLAGVAAWVLAGSSLPAAYVNFESSHVHPIALTPSGAKLLAVNTPDALLEVFAVQPAGDLVPGDAIPVGLEPVTVRARTDGEAWVVNNLSDSISIVDLALGAVVRTLPVGDEPTDVAFARGRAFVAVSSEDAVKVYGLADLSAPPSIVPLAGRDVRALAVSNDGARVYAVVLRSGNRTSIVGVHATFPSESPLTFDEQLLMDLGLRNMDCAGPTPPYPPLPAGITRNGALVDPPDGIPKVGLIVQWDDATGQWKDEAGTDWSGCLAYRPSDEDLFAIDAATLAVSAVRHVGTSLFEVSVHPQNGKIYVPNTEARNFVRFEHPLGVRGHMVDNRLSVVDPSAGNSITIVDLNTHIDRGSDPATNHAERQASLSQPGMMVWRGDGTAAYLTAIGSRKLFRVDGGCLSGSCIFGPDRASPAAVEVGEGPTGVALLEQPDPAADRLYVLNRISHSIAVVEAATLALVGEVPLHDPSPQATKAGRRFLYDGIDTSGHGDAACASCHLSGDLDGLAWDLGDPTGAFAPYTTPNDNVRFVVPIGGNPVQCSPSICAAHAGFDPQKGPMTTQSLRGMLEPLHWRGDRATMNDFNKAFVGLMGTADVGPINGAPAGLSASDMEIYRQFALAIRYPPNPFRDVDDRMLCICAGSAQRQPCKLRAVDPTCEIVPHGALLPGNPLEGEQVFNTGAVDAGQPCRACHTHPFGAGGGKQGGVPPQEPTSPDAAALFNGDADGSPHSDLKIPHLRNMYEKFGPVWAAPGDSSKPETPSGFGHVHDGSIPDLYRFLSANVFNVTPQNVRDLVAFMFNFPTGERSAVGRQVTLPAGGAPGSAADEALLGRLIVRGNRSSADRHCELTAAAISGGRVRRYSLFGLGWVTDAAGEPALSTAALRQAAQSPITFTCATLGSGQRLGGDRDEDLVLDGDDCAPADPETLSPAQTVTGLVLSRGASTLLVWNAQVPAPGPSLRYDVLGGSLEGMRAVGVVAATECVEGGLTATSWPDVRPDPLPGQGLYYLIRASNPCGTADLGAGLEPLEDLICP